MKKEVEELIPMLIGLAIISHSGPISTVANTFANEQIEWRLTGVVYIMSRKDSHLKVECWLKKKIGTGNAMTASYTNEGSWWGARPSENIQRTHEGLAVFVEGMLSAFPDLQEHLEPFLSAAEKQF